MHLSTPKGQIGKKVPQKGLIKKSELKAEPKRVYVSAPLLFWHL